MDEQRKEYIKLFKEESSEYLGRLNKIIVDTGGRISPTGEEPIWKKRDFLTMIRACFIPRLAFRITGTYACDGMMGQETIDNCAMTLKLDGRLRDKYLEKGLVTNDGIYHNWGVTYEGGHWALLEGGYPYDTLSEEALKLMAQMASEGDEIALKLPVGGLAWTAAGPKVDVMGPMCGNFQNFMRKIKMVFDPNAASYGYISAEQE